MKSLLKLCCAILIASSSAFFILVGEAGKVEAKMCPLGEFPHLQADGETTKCENAVKEDNSKEKVDGIKNYMVTFLKVVMVAGSSIVVIVITYAGYLYVMSQGNAVRTEQAKQMLFQAGIGILVLSVAFTIMNLLSTTVGITW